MDTRRGIAERIPVIPNAYRAVRPFALAKPLKIISEGCTECDGAFGDKAASVFDKGIA